MYSSVYMPTPISQFILQQCSHFNKNFQHQNKMIWFLHFFLSQNNVEPNCIIILWSFFWHSLTYLKNIFVSWNFSKPSYSTVIHLPVRVKRSLFFNIMYKYLYEFFNCNLYIWKSKKFLTAQNSWWIFMQRMYSCHLHLNQEIKHHQHLRNLHLVPFLVPFPAF